MSEENNSGHEHDEHHDHSFPTWVTFGHTKNPIEGSPNGTTRASVSTGHALSTRGCLVKKMRTLYSVLKKS